MNDRHRQVEKARRMLVKKRSALASVAFREAVGRLTQAFTELGQAVTEAINAAVASLQCLDWKAFRAALEPLTETDKEVEANAES